MGFSIHVRAGDEARKLATKLRATENGAPSAPHDACWSDDRWFIVRERAAPRRLAAARRLEDLPALLAVANAAGVEIGLHAGRAETILVEDLQRVRRGAQLCQAAGITEISIRIAEGESYAARRLKRRGLATGIRGYAAAAYLRRCADRPRKDVIYPWEYGGRPRKGATYRQEY
ncbi:hypothetical protein WMF37_40825 [Sorangium sp. So ce291]|uniref:hypothetical protein n=1 Tax=Sorangium sp. So ce291 TaxID=3133294 RepID=UPI003F63EE68